MSLSFSDQLRQALEAGEPFALGLITGRQGSSPQKEGARALFFADGRMAGTLGGGCLEAEVQDRARRALRTGQPGAFDLLLDHDFGWDDGLICGGRVFGVILPGAAQQADFWRDLLRRERVRTWGVREDFTVGWCDEVGAAAGGWRYMETVRPPCPLWLAGSGHVAQAVAPLAAGLDFAVTVFDDRPALVRPERFPPGTRLRVGAWEELFREVLPADGVPAFGLILTRGHQRDALVLADWIRRPFGFLGMIGSRRKARLVREQFLAEGLATAAELDRVACPVGVEIQSRTLPEIAVSIAAQLVARRAALLPRA